MTQGEALYRFFSGFGIPAFTSNNVPSDVVMPFLTYEAKLGFTGDEYSCAVNIYYHTDSEAEPNAKAYAIGEDIGLGGVQLPFDSGSIWIKRATPFVTPIPEADASLKHKQLLTMIEIL